MASLCYVDVEGLRHSTQRSYFGGGPQKYNYMVERNSPWIDSRGDVFMSALSGGVFVAGDRLKNLQLVHLASASGVVLFPTQHY